LSKRFALPSLPLLALDSPQTRPQAVTYYNAKVDYLDSNLSSLEDLIAKKRDNQNVVASLLQDKIQAQVA